jgi:hypothetical protein
VDKMYKVKLKTIMMGPNTRVMSGDVIDVDDITGKQLITSGSAGLIMIIPDEIETTMIQPIENAMMPKSRGRKPR